MKIVCLDTEHTTKAFRPYEPDFYMTCVGIVTEEGGERDEQIIWFDHADMAATENGLEIIQECVDTADLLVFHNAKHDIAVLHGFGIHCNDVKLWCTMITDYLIEGQNNQLSYKLNEVAQRYELGEKMDEVAEYWNRGIDTYNVPDWLLGPYCLKDCNLTMDIYFAQMPRVEEADLWRVVNLQNEYTYVLEEMETNGLLLSSEMTDSIVKEYQEKLDEVAGIILKGIPDGDKINLSSHQQLSSLLFGGSMTLSWMEWKIREYKTKPYSTYKETMQKKTVDFPGIGFKGDPHGRKPDGYYKVDKDTIRTLTATTAQQRLLKKALVQYSEWSKVISTLEGRKGDKGLLAKIMPDGCIHPSLNQTISTTGRLTSSNPNGQNLPRGNTSPIKTCFVPRYDGIMQVDLSQIEWRDAAWLSQDEVMIDEINSGVDQHVSTVTDLMELVFVSKKDPKSKKNRDHAKVFNFRMIFGGTKWGYYLDINMPNFTIKKWQKIIDAFWKKYKGLDRYHNENIKFVFRNGYIKIPTGRWFKFNKKHIKTGEFTYAVNQIKNYPIQGMSGGDILPLMAVIIRRGMRKMGLRSKFILTVHDSIVFDYCEEERDKLSRLCYNVGNNLGAYIQNYYNLDWNVKLECEVECGPNYGALQYLSPKEVRL